MKYVKCQSHKARGRLFAALNRKPQGYWSLIRKSLYGIYEINYEEIDKVKSIKGITFVKGDTSDLMKCWSQ